MVMLSPAYLSMAITGPGNMSDFIEYSLVTITVIFVRHSEGSLSDFPCGCLIVSSTVILKVEVNVPTVIAEAHFYNVDLTVSWQGMSKCGGYGGHYNDIVI